MSLPESWIDLHHHFCPPAYISDVGATIPLQPVLRDWTPAQSLEDMDRSGVRTAVLSITTPGLSFGDDAAARRLARTCNEYAAELSREHRGRFGFFASVPLPDVEGTLEELAYALDVLGADGVGFFTSYGKRWLGDPFFTPVLDELDRRGAIAYTHPTVSECCRDLLPDINESIIEYGTDTTRAIARLLFSGSAARYPNIRFIFSHAGGTMPFLVGRFVNLAKNPMFVDRLPRGILYELQRFFYDIAQSSNRGALSSLTALVPASQIVFGTDFPYADAQSHITGLESSRLHCGLTAGDLAAIAQGNALTLLPRLRSPAA